MLEALATVEKLWVTYGAFIDISTRSVEDAHQSLPQISELNLPVLHQMNKTVGEFERHYSGTGTIHPVLALAINVAGRQRMLSQKASKEFCLIIAGQDVAANRAALAQTIALFDTSLQALRNGDDDMGMPAAPTEKIQTQLQIVADLWNPLRAVLEATATGAAPTKAQINQIAHDNNPLLKEMNAAVTMYSQL